MIRKTILIRRTPLGSSGHKWELAGKFVGATPIFDKRDLTPPPVKYQPNLSIQNAVRK